MFGFLNVYKHRGITSFDVIAKLRRITGIKQIGHAGTIDPFAAGVLPISIGKATRLIEYLTHEKVYIATIQFGKNTNTYDLDGEVVETFDKKVTQIELDSILDNFIGEISQFPPIYSAIKVNGKKLYEYARQNIDVEIKPRKVVIKSIELLNFDEYNQIAVIKVNCNQGTYIRSLAFDIGKSLCCGAYLVGLERIQSGKFVKDDSIKLEDLTSKKVILDNLINPINILEYPVLELSETEKNKVIHGNDIHCKAINVNSIVFLVYSGKIYAIGQLENGKVKIKKVFEVS